jgi:hypothetical protein
MLVVDMDPQAHLLTYNQGNSRMGAAINITQPADTYGNSYVTDGTDYISASGKYAIATYAVYNTGNPDSIGEAYRIFDINPSNLALTVHNATLQPGYSSTTSPTCQSRSPQDGFIWDLGHEDVAQNPFDNNEDIVVGQLRPVCAGTVNGVELGSVVMVRLRDGKVSKVTSRYIGPPNNQESTAQHISTRNIDRPGWAYLTYWEVNGARFSDEVVAVKLDGSGALERLAHKHSLTEGCYRCESHAVPSRNGLRVIFASFWASNCDIGCSAIPASVVDRDIKDYVVDTRQMVR